MDWCEDVKQALLQGKTVTIQPPHRPALEEGEVVTIIPARFEELAIEDLILINIGQMCDFYQIKNIENDRFYIGSAKGFETAVVRLDSIYGKVIGRDVIFKKLELSQILEDVELSKTIFPSLEIKHYVVPAYSSSNLPEEIWLLTGFKANFDGPIEFWLDSLQYLQTKDRLYTAGYYAEESYCEFLSITKFKSLVQPWFDNLQNPLDLIWIEQIKRAQFMHDSPHHQSILAETEDKFVAIFRSYLGKG
jgi:hypothetical protein